MLLALEMSEFARELARRESGANIRNGRRHRLNGNCCGWRFSRRHCHFGSHEYCRSIPKNHDSV